MLRYIDSAARRIFLNNSGFRGNLTGGARLVLARRLPAVESGKMNSVEEEGFAKCESVVQEENIRSIYRKFDDLVESGVASENKVDGKLIRNNLLLDEELMENELPEVTSVVEKTRPMASSAIGCEAELDAARIYRTYSAPDRVLEENEVASQLWHFDPWPVDRIRVLVPLDESYNSSKTQFVGRQRAQELVREYPYEDIRQTNPSFIREDDISVPSDCDLGDVVVADVIRCLHRGQNPKEGNPRNMLQLTFRPQLPGI